VTQMQQFAARRPLLYCSSPYNLFERGIEGDVLAYCRKNDIATLGYGALCRGLLSVACGLTPYLKATICGARTRNSGAPLWAISVRRSKARPACQRTFRQACHSSRGPLMLDQGISTALWGARHPAQLEPVDQIAGWSIDSDSLAEIDRILRTQSLIPSGRNSWRANAALRENADGQGSRTIFLIAAVFAAPVRALADGDAKAGQALFADRCVACHRHSRRASPRRCWRGSMDGGLEQRRITPIRPRFGAPLSPGC